MIHFVHSYLHKDLHPITIDVIGCGGTGSHVLTRLARMHHVLVQLGFKGLLVSAWDFDIVEENNVGRQSFTENDIGKNKAKCLINKINIAFGTAWTSKAIKYNMQKINSNILITCVDNTETRNYYMENVGYELFLLLHILFCANLLNYLFPLPK